MGIALLLQELPEKGGQLGSHMPTGDTIGQLDSSRLLGLTNTIEHGQREVGALLDNPRNALERIWIRMST